MFGRLKGSIWGNLHEESERLAMEAESVQDANPEKSKRLYAEAAKKDEEALGHIQRENLPRTYEITICSTAALYYKARDFVSARRIAEQHKDTMTDPHCMFRLEEIIQALDNQT